MKPCYASLIAEHDDKGGPAPSLSRAVRIILCLLILIIMIASSWQHFGEQYEPWFTTPDIQDANYYGGFAGTAIETHTGLVPFHLESVDLVESSQRMLSRDPGMTATINADRIWSSAFVNAMLQMISFQRLDMAQAILLRNILLWLLAIWGAFEIARQWSRSETAGWVAALMLASFPTFSLMVESFKAQSAGVALFLAAIAIHDRWLSRLSGRDRLLSMTGFWFVLLLGSGSWLYFLIYLCLTRFFPDPRSRLQEIRSEIAPFLIAYFVKGIIFLTYGMKSSITVYVPKRILEILPWSWALVSGGDVSGERFLGQPGFDFFTKLIPLLVDGTWWTSPPVLLLLLPALFCGWRVRFLALAGLILFIPAHLPTILSGWYWHYGYSTALYMALFAICASIMLSKAFGHRWWLIKSGAGICLLVILAWNILPRNLHYDLFYGNFPRLSPLDRIAAFYDGKPVRILEGSWERPVLRELDKAGLPFIPAHRDPEAKGTPDRKTSAGEAQ